MPGLVVYSVLLGYATALLATAICPLPRRIFGRTIGPDYELKMVRDNVGNDISLIVGEAAEEFDLNKVTPAQFAEAVRNGLIDRYEKREAVPSGDVNHDPALSFAYDFAKKTCASYRVLEMTSATQGRANPGRVSLDEFIEMTKSAMSEAGNLNRGLEFDYM